MHEAALAAAVAEALRRPDVRGRPVNLLVTGGHTDRVAFDAALRFHLAAAAPEIDLEVVSIVHVVQERPCLGCGHTFAAADLAAECPLCGGIGLALPSPEQVQIELS